MQILNWKDSEEKIIDKFPYNHKLYDVKGISIRWLSKFGEDDLGNPEYGLRLFTAEPNGEIPIHNHYYFQTMYILSGQFECFQFNPETNIMVKSQICNPGDVIYIPSMEPHGMKNVSDKDYGTFLCCICNVYEE